MKINLPKTALKGPVEFEWKVPKWSNTIERNRARTYFQAYAAACALHFAEKALVEIRAGRTKTWEKFDVPKEGIGCGFTEAVRGVLSHHLVIRDGKIANYHPYPPTPWNANPRDSFGTPGPYEDAVQGQPIFEENDRRQLQGHRHHAHCPQLRPVPAVRGAHVPRGREEARDDAHAHPVRRRRLRPARHGAWTAHDPDPEDEAAAAPDLRATGERIDALIESIAGGGAGPANPTRSRERAEDLVRAVTDLYGAGLERLLEIVYDSGRLDEELLGLLAEDDLVASLLLVHGLHPYDVPTRVENALESVRPYLGSHGGDVELLEVSDDGRRTPSAARLLRRLPVLLGDAGACRAGRDRGGRTGGHLDRGGEPAISRPEPRR